MCVASLYVTFVIEHTTEQQALVLVEGHNCTTSGGRVVTFLRYLIHNDDGVGTSCVRVSNP
jgi:hypothetical protein